MKTSLTPIPASSVEAASPISREWVARVFERLTAQLGAKVADLYAGVPEQNVQAEWAAGLAGFHETEIARGIAACRRRVFAPTLGEFVLLCRPALEPERAWLEAQDGLKARDAGHMGDWSHPAVYRAAIEMSPEVRGGDFRKHRTRWAYVLEREFSKGWGEPVQLPPKLVVHKPTLRGPTPAERALLASLKKPMPVVRGDA